MKKKYTTPFVKEIKIKVENNICTLSGENDVNDNYNPSDPTLGKFEEWSFDWDE